MKELQHKNNMLQIMHELGKKAKEASVIIANATCESKNKAILAAAKNIRDNIPSIIKANLIDIAQAKEKNMDASLIDRLLLDENRLQSIARSLEDIASLDDPVGKELASWTRPSGLNIKRRSVPLGVIGIIFESRPNVTADAGSLCIKSGNAAILRGGSESFNSSRAIIDCLHKGLYEAGLPKDIIQLVPTTDRDAVGVLLTMSEYVDVIVPRGGKGLCKRIQDESKIPTLQHLDGNCHTYINKSAKEDMAIKVVYNAKLRRTGICGATESLIVDKEIAGVILPKIVDSLTKGGCEVRGDAAAQKIDSRIVRAIDEDYDTEYLAAIISVKIVSDIDEAINFINKHSSHHTDSIITEDTLAAKEFLTRVDSAIVMHNTSTQFADGGEFGMGAEIGISTGRLHARGPVGVEQLTTYKYIVVSDGVTRP
jgi:glutamate-5-semialdehyde dehydrogenase